MNRKWENRIREDGGREELLYEVREWASRAAGSYEELAKLFQDLWRKKMPGARRTKSGFLNVCRSRYAAAA